MVQREEGLQMKIDFVGKRKIFYCVSLVFIIVAFVSFFTKGFEQDIEFKGGTIIDIEMEQAVDNEEIKTLVKEVVANEEPRIQKSEQRDNLGNVIKSGVSISTSPLTEEQKEAIITKITEKYEIADLDNKVTYRTVKATFGEEMKSRAIQATIWSTLAIIIYIAFVFKKVGGASAAVTAFIKLIHDLIITLMIYSVFGLPLNTTFVAAILTVLGYSIDDTVIIYDRIRENGNLHRKMEMPELINMSINQTLRRTLFTSLSVMVALALLYGFSVYYNVGSIQEFSLPLLVGMIAGTYSSIFVASNLWADWMIHKKGKKVAKKA